MTAAAASSSRTRSSSSSRTRAAGRRPPPPWAPLRAAASQARLLPPSSVAHSAVSQPGRRRVVCSSVDLTPPVPSPSVQPLLWSYQLTLSVPAVIRCARQFDPGAAGQRRWARSARCSLSPRSSGARRLDPGAAGQRRWARSARWRRSMRLLHLRPPQALPRRSMRRLHCQEGLCCSSTPGYCHRSIAGR